MKEISLNTFYKALDCIRVYVPKGACFTDDDQKTLWGAYMVVAKQFDMAIAIEYNDRHGFVIDIIPILPRQVRFIYKLEEGC